MRNWKSLTFYGFSARPFHVSFNEELKEGNCRFRFFERGRYPLMRNWKGNAAQLEHMVLRYPLMRNWKLQAMFTGFRVVKYPLMRNWKIFTVFTALYSSILPVSFNEELKDHIASVGWRRRGYPLMRNWKMLENREWRSNRRVSFNEELKARSRIYMRWQSYPVSFNEELKDEIVQHPPEEQKKYPLMRNWK